MIDLITTMELLAHKRPVFSSEADFQLALAWKLQLGHPGARLRLEYRPAYLDRRGYLDIWASDHAWTLAIELKYFTRALDFVVGDERFELLNQGAQDINRYDFVATLGVLKPSSQARPTHSATCSL